MSSVIPWEFFESDLGRPLVEREIKQNCNLALFAGIKKTQKTPAAWMNIAVDRRKLWLLRQVSV